MGHACDDYDIVLICCADFRHTGTEENPGLQNVCKDPQPTIEPEESPSSGFHNLVPDVILKILPEIVPELVIP